MPFNVTADISLISFYLHIICFLTSVYISISSFSVTMLFQIYIQYIYFIIYIFFHFSLLCNYDVTSHVIWFCFIYFIHLSQVLAWGVRSCTFAVICKNYQVLGMTTFSKIIVVFVHGFLYDILCLHEQYQ